MYNNNFGTYQNPYQNKFMANQFVGKPMDQHVSLPQVRNKFRDVEDQKLNLVNETLNFVNNRSKRAMNGRGPFTNYPMYNPDIVNFLNNYPHSLMHYRPMRYFFQRPVQLDENTHFPHQKQSILHNRAEYETAKEISKNMPKRLAKPLKFSDLINQAEELELPMAKVISAGEVNQKIEELNKAKEELFKLDPKRRKEIRLRNRKHWQFIHKLSNITNFWRILQQFKVGSKKYQIDKTLLDRAQRADIGDLAKYFSRYIEGLETVVRENFGAYLVFNSNNEQKNEDSVWITKRFIQKLFHDLATATTDRNDIDPHVRAIIKNYIREGAFLPPNFISTQSFNRLQYGLDWGLRKLNHERQAMIVCFLVLVKTILLHILNSPQLYFPNIEKTKLGGSKVKTEYEHDEKNVKEHEEEKKKKEEARKKFFGDQKTKEDKMLEKLGRKDVMTIVLNNFEVIRGIVNYILKDAFKLAPNIYREVIKEKFMYRHFVYNGQHGDMKMKLAEDDNEFSKLAPINDQAKIFIENNQRWINFYKMNAVGFSMNLVELCQSNDPFKENNQERDKKEKNLAEKRRNDELYGDS